MQENLVIVESPAKAKTIEKFLGKDYVVKSSFGHIRDLAKKDLGIDLDGGFSPIYEIPDDKKKVVAELSKLAHSVKTVWLASDEDREGEAIAWHLTEVLGLPVATTKRIVFHEITKKAILSAIEEPRTVNMDLVNAQQARRVLDRLVGFELSPVLWKKVKPSLSAGRVQSVAVRLLVEREREIIDFKATDYYRVVAQFSTDDKTTFRAELSHRFEKREEAVAFLESCKGARFTVVKSEEKPSQRVPAPPFTTSTLQQEAGRKLGMSVSQTMSLAQRLYEQGLITYMRTDSVNLSGQALAQTKEEVIKLFGEKYHQIRNYKTKTKGAQEAHEAIRPSYLDRTTIEGNAAEKRLYELIWKRTVASQMVAAEIDRTVVTIEMNGGEAQFIATGEVVRFDGFLKLYSESTDDDQNADATQGMLPALAVGQQLEAQSIVATQRFTQAPTRYNEALLVKRLEELGIGRPSTYAPTITTIINRGYVVKQNKEGVKRSYEQLTLDSKGVKSKMLSENIGKEKSRLAPTDIGMVVNDYLESSFPTIMDYNFTASVEKQFDEIAEGEMEWNKMIGEFYSAFHPTVEQALETQSTKTNQVRVLGIDPASGKEVSARIGRYGPMVQIGGNDGDKARFASLKAGQLIASITLEEALELFSLPRDLGELNGDRLVVGLGKFGPYLRNNGKFTSLPKSEDPYTIGYERAVELVEAHEKELATANQPVKTFAEDAEMLIKNGRYGVYIAYKGKNYRIPKGRKVEDLTYADCLKIVDGSKK
ncbi:MAG: type I DNA topoisomerase [Rikenellaceae bacterium]|nr:type I DNA topoisomerase [Rikenellaceae bacterium]MBR2419904.1 type I DNA topoisomerase [Rikenellaceae bacterium]MBR3801754.1 type I DNA topoisomerase [Rikenellaceae bacterium]